MGGGEGANNNNNNCNGANGAATTTICRTCLTETNQNQHEQGQERFKSVFRIDENSGVDLHIAEMIMAYTSVQITLGDGLPEEICETCAEKAVSMYLFKLKCEESDAILRQKLNKTTNFYASLEEKASFSLGIDPSTIDIIIKPEYATESEGEELNIERHCSRKSKNYALLNVDDDDNNVEEQIENCEDYFFDAEQEHLVRTGDIRVKSEKILNKLDENSSDLWNLIKKIVCEICYKEFSSINHLNRHRKSHFRNFACAACKKSFSRKDLLVKHQESVHSNEEVGDGGERGNERDISQTLSSNSCVEEAKMMGMKDISKTLNDYSCMICNQTFSTKEDYSVHALTHMEKKDDSSIECHICHKRLTKTTHLTRHLKIHCAIKPYICQLCGKGFARMEQLNNHKNVHSGIKPHVCKICNKGFNQVSNLKDHMRTHNGEKPFLCSICGKGFNQLGNLRQHTIRHSGIKAHLCSVCGNGFASKGELCAHLRKHTGARPFVCPVCNHGFTTSSSLTKHKRIHSGEKPYECDVCKMKFSRSGILARHKRTHTGEKPYVCKYCSKAFTQSNDLSSHLRIHTGEKPYICDMCGQAFRQSSALKTHKKVHIDKGILVEWSKKSLSTSHQPPSPSSAPPPPPVVPLLRTYFDTLK